MEVPAADVGDEYNAILTVSEPLRAAVAQRLGVSMDSLSMEHIRLVRKSLDARPPRRGRRPAGHGENGDRVIQWSHVVDVTLPPEHARLVQVQPGRIVPAAKERVPPPPAASAVGGGAGAGAGAAGSSAHVIVVGAGPCGYFAALTLALKTFKGAVVTVSHNEAFVAEIVNEKWIVENGGITAVQVRDIKAR